MVGQFLAGAIHREVAQAPKRADLAFQVHVRKPFLHERVCDERTLSIIPRADKLAQIAKIIAERGSISLSWSTAMLLLEESLSNLPALVVAADQVITRNADIVQHNC